MSTDYLVLVRDCEAEFSERNSRIDSDLNLFNLVPYVMEDYQGHTVKGVDNVTLNDPHIMAARVISVISSADPRIEVTGNKLSDDDAGIIEQFLNGAIRSANERNARKLLTTIHNYCTSTTVLQGWAGVRVVLWQSGGDLIFDVLPLDMRNVTYEVGSDGLMWAAYKTKRSKAAIEADYKYEIKGKTAEVIDFWSVDAHAVLVDKEPVVDEANSIGVPFVIHPVVIAPLFGDKGTKYYGDSIYSANRGLYNEANKQMTILQTHNSLTFRTPMAVLTDEGDKLPDQYPYQAGAMMALKKGEGFAPIPIGDISRSAPFAYAVLNKAVQLGGLPYSEYGTLDFPLSAIAIEKLEGHRDQVFLPRLQTLSLIYRDMSRMMIKQFIEGGVKAELGEEGEEIEYKPQDVDKGKFKIAFKMNTTSPEKNVSNYTIAAAAKNIGMSTDTIFRDILGLENPTEAQDKVLEEMAGQLIPAVQLYNIGMMFLRQAEDLEGDEKKAMNTRAQIVLSMMSQVLQQQMGQGQPGQEGMPQPKPQETGEKPLQGAPDLGAPMAQGVEEEVGRGATREGTQEVVA